MSRVQKLALESKEEGAPSPELLKALESLYFQILHFQCGIDRDDVPGEAYIGLAKALNAWEPKKGPFVTYSSYYLRGYGECYQRRMGHPLAIPNSYNKELDQELDFMRGDAVNHIEGYATAHPRLTKADMAEVLGEEELEVVELFLNGVTRAKIAFRLGTTVPKALEYFNKLSEKIEKCCG